jgi:hypothetical protein
MYSCTPFRFLSAHLRSTRLLSRCYSFPLRWHCNQLPNNRATLFNLAASTERAIIRTLAFTAGLISWPRTLLLPLRSDRRAVQLCFLPPLLTFAVFCRQSSNSAAPTAIGSPRSPAVLSSSALDICCFLPTAQ